MTKIFKYTLYVTDRQTIQMPIVYEILSIQNQGDTMTIWALVDTAFEITDVVFYIYGTGHDVHHNHGGSNYVGTVQMNNGLVWHVFRG